MSTHNLRFYREIRKILCGYPLLFVAMLMKYCVFHDSQIGVVEWCEGVVYLTSP